MQSNYLFSRSLASFGRRDQREMGRQAARPPPEAARAVAALVINSVSLSMNVALSSRVQN